METGEESCENCRHLQSDDDCGNPESVYFGRPMVYRDGDEVLQAGWCEHYVRRISHNGSGGV
ncbi:MAG TPA: hypothetical protein VF898_14980 [Chloroflexota bacterium]